jgi:Cu2+-exporting ATPase
MTQRHTTTTAAGGAPAKLAAHNAGGHGAHDGAGGHAGHDKHAGHDPEVFRRRFWLTLLLSLP